MCPNYLFDALNVLLQKVKRSKLFMGGVQTILCGDFMQLPPVAKNAKHPPYLFTSEAFQKYITTKVQLCKSFRQQGDD